MSPVPCPIARPVASSASARNSARRATPEPSRDATQTPQRLITSPQKGRP